MVKALERQKPSSKKDILAALDKVRPNLPVKPLPKSKQQAPIITEEPKAVKGLLLYRHSNSLSNNKNSLLKAKTSKPLRLQKMLQFLQGKRKKKSTHHHF